MRALADLDQHSGEIQLGEQAQQTTSPPAWRKQIGYLPADAIFWTETMAQYFDRFADHYVNDLIQTLQLNNLLSLPLNKLSSGEKQRFALVRLLANKPSALLLDEPTSHLDPELSLVVESTLTQYQQAHDCPMLLVSHDEAQCARITGQRLSMNNKELIPI